MTLGLAWDVKNRMYTVLDASAVCLDESFEVVDIVSYQSSDDGSIQHNDEREGDKGGNENLLVTLRLNLLCNSFVS